MFTIGLQWSLPDPIPLLTRRTYNNPSLQSIYGIYRQQENGRGMGIKIELDDPGEPDRETAPSTGPQHECKQIQNPSLNRVGCVPYFKFQYVSSSQQSLMSLLRTRPGELAVRGNYLCRPQHRTMQKQKILYLQILEETLQHFASEMRVFSYAECYLSEQYPGSGQHGLSISRLKLLGSHQRVGTNRHICKHTHNTLRREQAQDLNAQTHTSWEIGHAL